MDDPTPNFKFLGVLGVIIIVLILIFAGLTFVIVRMVSDIGVEVGSITIDIDDRQCNVSAHLDFSPDIDVQPKELSVLLEHDELPLGYEDKLVWVMLDEQQFTEIVEKEEIRIKGTVATKNSIGISSEREVDEKVDISFLGEILSNVDIEDAKLSTKFPFITVVEFNLSVEMDREVNIFANNTEATISNGVNDHKVDLINLVITSEGIGSGRVEMPTSTLFILALWGKNVTISAWGLEAGFIFPFTS